MTTQEKDQEKESPGGTGTEPVGIEDMRRDIAELLDRSPGFVRDADDLLRLGLDSIAVIRLASRWQQAGSGVRAGDLLARRTLSEWWSVVKDDPRDRPSRAVELPVVDEFAPFELSPMQHAYWVGRADGQAMGSVGAHFYTEFDGHGIDPDRLARSVRAIVRRHGMLRARFRADGRAQIMPESALGDPAVHDLRDLEPTAADRRACALRETLSQRRMDVARGEVFHLALSLLPGGATRLHVSIEMLVADARSFRMLLADLASAYAGAPERAPLSVTYPQYLAARARHPSPRWETDRRYWRDRLGELPGPPELPVVGDTLRLSGHRTTRRYRWLGPDERNLLADQAGAHGVTLPVTLMTAFADVLATWSGQSRFLLNLPRYDRQPLHPDVEHLVGDFTELLLLAVETGGEDDFAGRAHRVQRQLRSDISHCSYSGLDVLRDLSHHRGAAVGAPVVFTSALSLGELFGPSVRRCFGEPGWTTSQTPQVWLDHQVTERAGGLFLNWDAVTGLHPDGMLEAMFTAYGSLLDGLITGRGWSERTPLVPPRQLAVRAAANDTSRPAAETGVSTLHEPFFAHACGEPGRTALVRSEDDRWTYGEVASAALHIAGALRERGLRPGDPVAITLPKGPDQAVAVLGVLAAGGAYVPIGIEQPPSRRARMIGRAGLRLALADGADTTSGAWPREVEVLTMAAARTATPLAAPVSGDPDRLAYIIFTSGSTGEPKGVELTHRAAANTVADLNERFEVGEHDRTFALSALDFDLSVYDIFGPLAVGGAVVLVDEAARRDPARWIDLLIRNRVSIINCVPTLLDTMVTLAGDLGDRLRLVLIGGDWVGVELPGKLARLRPDCRFVALGGTTETAIHSTLCEITEVPAHWRSIPYGTPLRNVACRVVDAGGRDCPDRVTGELWIGGTGVARGYRGDPKLTAQRFVEHDGTRWYRTGDLARYWSDGALEFLGRRDHQVKILGHRIELGEVESALAAAPEVAAAVAVAVGEPARLAAAVVLAPGNGQASADVAAALRCLLADRLPPTMLPDRIAVLDLLPLSANGKVDRAQVSAALHALGTGAADEEPPLGLVETRTALAWQDLLGVRRVHRRDSFFALGGDSLLAVRLLGRLAADGVHGATLPALFARPALADFAAGLFLGEATRRDPVLPVPAARFEPFEPTDVQRAYWVGRGADFTLGGVGSHWYWEFDGVDVDVDRLERAWNSLVQRHDMLRAVFDADGRQRVLATVPATTIPVTVAGPDDADTALARLRDTLSHRVPDPSQWPLVEIRAVRHGDRTRIAFSFDYIVLDALSIVIVFAELAARYHDPMAELPEIGITFRDYVTQARTDPQEADRAWHYWQDRLDELPPPPRLPLRTDPALVSAPRFVRRQARLPAGPWAGLCARARDHGVTPAAVLLTAFTEVLAAWSAQPELTVTLTLFDRREVHPDVSRIVGDFTSLLLVASRPVRGETWSRATRRIQEQVWTGMQHRAASAIEVMRELARRGGPAAAAMPVVFTSALGLSDELVGFETGFGEQVWGISQTPQIWLDNQVFERGGELSVNWDAVADLFPEGLLDSAFDAYVRLLHWLSTSDWDGEAPALLPAAQRETRARVNDSAGPVPRGLLHDGFFAMAARCPDSPALVWGRHGRWHYGQLADRALRVAAGLVRAGVRPGDPVAVHLPKGADQVAAVLAVLAAGGVYVPVGVDQPPARRDRILADAGVRAVLVAQDASLDDASLDTGAVPVLTMAVAGTGQSLTAPVPADPESLAYIIYTSGSTGEPKGVEITHAAALNTVTDINSRFDVGPGDRVLAVSALDFDLSVYDVFGLLAAGGALVLVPEGGRREAWDWVTLLREHRVTIWNTVPALLDMLLVAAEGEPIGASLRLALVSGDWVGLDLPDRLRARAPQCRLVALGGATEASIWSNAFEVERVAAGWRSIPYGFPLRNQCFRVVDPLGRDRPDWVPGELWIGGSGVARGYRGDPERSARRFVEHAGRRWYRTGDLGRYWPDGTLEFLGRTDLQVKIRGHRVELGEVEAALRIHPEVSDAVALAVGEPVRRLVAAVVGPAVPDGLRPFVAELLPSYLVPERVVAVEAMPLTANGKVDRAALARIVAGEAPVPDRDAPPEGELEMVVADVWQRLLDAPAVGRHSSFFALGGDSLLAARVLEQLRRRLGVVLSMRELFSAPTVAALAEVLAATRDAAGSVDMEEGAI